jgi:hypothetical protein
MSTARSRAPTEARSNEEGTSMRRDQFAGLLMLASLALACQRSGGETSLRAVAPAAREQEPGVLGGTVSGLPAGQTVTLSMNDPGKPSGLVRETFGEGSFRFDTTVDDGDGYAVRVTAQPAGAYCVVRRGIGTMRGEARDVEVRCDADEATALFDTDRVHHLRFQVTADEWNAFVMNTDRSRYQQDASGNTPWFLPNGVSELYRRGRLELLDDRGRAVQSIDDVGFRMRGTTSRVWPEDWEQTLPTLWAETPSGPWTGWRERGWGTWATAASPAPSIPPGVQVASAAVSNVGVETDLYFVDATGAVNVTWTGDNAEPWQGPFPFTAPGVARPGGGIAVSSRYDHTGLFFVDPAGAVNVMWSSCPHCGWTSPQPITGPGVIPAGAALAASPQFGLELVLLTDQIDVFFVDGKGAVNVLWGSEFGPWHGPAPITAPGATRPGGALVATKPFGQYQQTDLLFVDANGAVNVMWVVDDGAWQGPAPITASGVAPAGAAMTAASSFHDSWRTNVFFVDRAGAANVMWVVGVGDWQGPTRIGPAGLLPAGARVATPGQLELAGMGRFDGRPRRFHWNFKFDEDFSGLDDAYSCIDEYGDPSGAGACQGRFADDILPIPANEGRKFLGLESLALKYNRDDPTYVREALSYALLDDEGVPASRAAHATLTLEITGAPGQTLFDRPLPQSYEMGVFTMVEPVDKTFLQRRFGKNGYLFKVSGGDLTDDDPPGCMPWEQHGTTYVNPNFCVIGVEQLDPENRIEWVGSDHPLDQAFVNGDINRDGATKRNDSQFAPYRPLYDLKTKKGDVAAARTALRSLIAVVKDPHTTAAQLAAVFDVEGFIQAQAVEIAVGAVDHYARVANNYYLYLNPQTGKWTYLPQDFDFSFRDMHLESWESNPPFADVSGATVFGADDGWTSRRVPGVNPRVWDIVFSDAGNRARLLEELTRIHHRWLDWEWHTGPVVAAWMEALAPWIRRTQAGDPDTGDTAFNPAAALGDAYTYASWVNPANLASRDQGGSYPPGAWAYDLTTFVTVKNFVRYRYDALAPEMLPLDQVLP